MSEAVSLPPTLTTYESSDPLKVSTSQNPTGPQSLNTQIPKENDDEEMSPGGGLVTNIQGPAHGPAPTQGPEASKCSAHETSSNDEPAGGNNASGSAVGDNDDVVTPDNSTEENLAL